MEKARNADRRKDRKAERKKTLGRDKTAHINRKPRRNDRKERRTSSTPSPAGQTGQTCTLEILKCAFIFVADAALGCDFRTALFGLFC